MLLVYMFFFPVHCEISMHHMIIPLFPRPLCPCPEDQHPDLPEMALRELCVEVQRHLTQMVAEAAEKLLDDADVLLGSGMVRDGRFI